MFNMKGRQMEKMMRQMGIKTEEIDAEEVIIKTPSKELVVENPQVTKVKMGGEETLQIIGKIIERGKEKFTKEDIETVMSQTGANEEGARKALEEEGDMAAAIIKLKK
ncbi:MAG: nascent polypeptide-associated complex protein, partial [Candidatus Aenigmatarchaeota archaeon]